MTVETVDEMPPKKVFETSELAQRVIDGHILKITCEGRYSRDQTINRVRKACDSRGVLVTTRSVGTDVAYIQRRA
jgi:hypothetical protein